MGLTYVNYDQPLLHSLWRMQMRGVRIDIPELEKAKDRVDDEITELKEEFRELTDIEDINVKSFKQMSAYLYDTLNLPKQYKWEKGKRKVTTNEEALEKLFARNPSLTGLKILLEIRRRRTIRENVLSMKLSEDGRIRTEYGLTKTGRLSSSADIFKVGTNLQNVPKSKGAWVRALFIADEGKVFIVADLSQAENMIIAWASRQENLKRWFKDGEDVHAKTGSIMFNLPESTFTNGNPMRTKIKNIRYGRNYDMGMRTFADLLGVSMKEARVIANDDDRLFPNIRGVYYAEIEQQLMRDRTLTNPLGRKRRFLGKWGDKFLREAYNFIPQSTVADYINWGIIRLDRVLPEGADILLQVHDELVVQCEPSQVEEVSRMLKETIEHPLIIGGDELVIPLDIEVGSNWKDTVKLDKWKDSKYIEFTNGSKIEYSGKCNEKIQSAGGITIVDGGEEDGF